MSDIILKATQIVKSYGKTPVLKGVNLEVARGQIMSIIGASGAGKSTLLNILSSFDQDYEGEVLIDGLNVGRLKGKKLNEFRNQKMGFVYQFHHLLPEFSALDNVLIPAWVGKVDADLANERANKLLTDLGLIDKKHRMPSELSGGEQQRIAVARALINQPAIVFADEPSGNLDSANAWQLYDLFQEIKERYNQSIVLVTHNEALAQHSDASVLIKDGSIS